MYKYQFPFQHKCHSIYSKFFLSTLQLTISLTWLSKLATIERVPDRDPLICSTLGLTDKREAWA